MFDITECLCKLLKGMDGGGNKKKVMWKHWLHVFLSHTAGHVLLNMSPKLAVMSMMDVPRTSEPPFEGLATSVWNGLHLQSGGLNHSHCDTGYIKKTLRAKSLSCQRNDMSERRKYFTGTNGKTKNKKNKGWGGTSGICCLMRPFWPPDRFNSLTMLSSISFNFSGVYNVISAEDLTRSLSFNWFCWESVERPSLTESDALYSILHPLNSFLLVLFFSSWSAVSSWMGTISYKK